MDQVLMQNIEFLRENRKNIDTDRLLEEALGYEVYACADANSLTVSKHTEEGPIRLHSLYEPEREGALMAQKYIDTSNVGSTFVCYGFGLGYVHKHLARLVEDFAHIIIIEPGYEVLGYYARLFDVREIMGNENVFFVIHEDTKELSEILRRHITPFNAYHMEFKFSPVYQLLFPEKFQEYLGLLKDIMVGVKITSNTLLTFGKKWIKNQLENLPKIADQHCASAFFGVLEGRAAVLVSSGPSLDKNVELLREIQGRVLIVAAYSSIRTLTELGIEPDIYCSLDANQILYTLPDGGHAFDTPLACVSITSADVVRHHSGRKIVPLITADKMMGELFRRIGRPGNLVDSGSSVACFMMDFLKRMGAGAVVLIGQDLAFTDGKHHAQAYLHGQDYHKVNDVSEMSGGGLLEVEGMDGGTVLTNNVFRTYLDWFEGFARTNTSMRLINATEGGARIKGMEEMSFREAIDSCLAQEEAEGLRQALERAYGGRRLLGGEELGKARVVFGEVLGSLREVLGVIDAGIEASVDMMELCAAQGRPSTAALNTILDRMDATDKILEQNSQNIRFLSTAFHHHLIQVNRLRRHNEDEGVYLAERTKEMYEGIREICGYSVELIEKMIGEFGWT